MTPTVTEITSLKTAETQSRSIEIWQQNNQDPAKSDNKREWTIEDGTGWPQDLSIGSSTCQISANSTFGDG
ncbi:hypothetical protein RRG08_063325 [Elysia crispata]|uniref:Uncharacterized protein n=1 Tax=Elysia crispata TaxID=231223 RepID=A0AAE0ZXB0_9GAST|nr:hypothetical protein RRG08_063325 [Elysia crispata]